MRTPWLSELLLKIDVVRRAAFFLLIVICIWITSVKMSAFSELTTPIVFHELLVELLYLFSHNIPDGETWSGLQHPFTCACVCV